MKRLIGLMFAVMVFVLPGVKVWATEAVSYMVWDETDEVLKEADEPCSSYTPVETDTTSESVTWSGGWYVVSGSDITISNRITTTGIVNLILCDDCGLNAQKGIYVPSGSTLNIYPGSTTNKIKGNGKLNAVGDAYCAGIGGNNGSDGYKSGDSIGNCGTITISGGIVTARGGDYGAGIGAGNGGAKGTVIINGGIVNATGGSCSAGIGTAGYDPPAPGTAVSINGGIVTATGNDSCDGIGKGASSPRGSLTLGENVKLYGDSSPLNIKPGAEKRINGEGSPLTYTRKQYMKALGPISYMKWDESEKKLVPASTGSTEYTIVTNQENWNNTDPNTGWYVVSNDVTIENRIAVTGTVNLILCDGVTLTAERGITVSEGNTLNIYGQSGGTGELEATNGNYFYLAAIGGEGDDTNNCSNRNCGTITINGGKVKSTSSVSVFASYGAGIGGGNYGSGGVITINGGIVEAIATSAVGRSYGAGIGGGCYGSGKEITINGGKVTATVTAPDTSYGAGIGGGYCGSGGDIKITGGYVTATGGSYAGQGIGKGNGGSGSGTLKVSAPIAVYAHASDNTPIDSMTLLAKGNKDDEGLYSISDGRDRYMKALTRIKLDKTGATLNTGETLSLIATVLPEGSTDTVVWTSSSSSIASVNNGTVTAVSAGTADIIATVMSGDTEIAFAVCQVTVKSSGGNTPSPQPSTPDPVTPDPTPTYQPVSDPTSPAYGKTPAEAPKTETIGDKTITTTKYTDGSIGVKTMQKTADGTEIVSEKITEQNGDWVSATTVTSPDGSKTVTDESSDATGDNTSSKTVKTDASGKVIESETMSKTVDKDTKATVETHELKNSEGTLSEKTTTQENGDYESVSEKRDPDDKLIEKTESSKTANSDDTTTLFKKTTKGDNSSESQKATLDKNGTGKIDIENDEGNGSKDFVSYDVTGNKATVSSVIVFYKMNYRIPSEIIGLDGITRKVNMIGMGACEGQELESVKIPPTIEKVQNGAFKDTGMTEMAIEGSVSKDMFEKDSLKGCGKLRKRASNSLLEAKDKDPKGKGLTIYVQSKKDQKALKKQLKKAGAPKAKVKIAK